MDSFKKNKLGITPLEKRVMLDASLPAIAGQVLWLDAADAATIIDTDGDNAATGTGGANNGFAGTVATWRDKSASGFHVSAAGSERPNYGIDTLNTRGVIRFDGTDDRLYNAGASIAGDDATTFIIFQRTSAVGRDGIIEVGSGISRTGLWTNEGGTARYNYYMNGTFYNSANTYTVGAYSLVSMTQDVTAAQMHINGASQMAAVSSARVTTTGIYLADDSTSGDWLQGNIAEVLIYDRDLTSEERHDVENYLASKWGLSITNTAPVSAINTGTTLNEGATTTVINTMLSYTDADNTDSTLIYTVTDAADYGTLTNTNTATALILGSTFTQADINSGYITYTHNGSETTSDNFQFTVSDQLAVTAASTFAFTVNPMNDAPTLDINAPITVNEGASTTITNTYLSSSDVELGPPSLNWYNASWQYRQLITIDQSYINSNLTDFTTLLKGTNMTAGFWSNVNADGSDIVITAVDGTTKLNRELVSINTALNTMELYAKIPAVDGAVNTSFYIYYGNAGASEVNNTSTWVGNYAGVWHLNDTSGSVSESTANNLTGTLQGAVTQGATGIIGNAISVNGSSAVQITNSVPLQVNSTDSFSYETWFRGTSTSVGLISMMNQTENYQGYDIWVDGGRAAMHLINSWSGDALKVISNVTVNDNAWHHIVVTYDGSKAPSGVKIYVDGVNTTLSVANNNLVSADTAPNAPFRIGSRSVGVGGTSITQGTTGLLDEVRFYDGVLGADYIAAQYANTVNTASFYTVATPESYSSGVIYEVTGLISNGTIYLNSVALGISDTFTQYDIDNNLLTYTHNAGETTVDSFQFTISDGAFTSGNNTFNINVTPVNDSPLVATNTGTTVLEGASVVITTAMLNEGDPDDSGTGLTYTASSLTNGHITVGGVTQNTFTQADIDAGVVEFVHNGSETLSASFAFSLADGGEDAAIPATGTFSLTVTPQNDAPIIGGSTLVTSENFQSGATGWSINTTTAGGTVLTTFLGLHSLEAGAQNVHKTYTLSGNQNFVTISFDMYEIDSWDGENFIVYVDNLAAMTIPLTQGGYNSPASGTNGAVSWVIQNTTPFNGNFAFGTWNDQTYHFDLQVSTTGSSIKLGFSSTLNQATNDEAWGVDNLVIREIDDGGVPGPFYVSEISPNTTVIGTITATDPDVADTRTFSIAGGTGAGIFSINPATGVITVTNAAALDYETTTSYTLDIVVTDAGGLTDSETITVNVLDVPENTAPVLAAIGPLSVAENATVGTALGTMTSTDAEGNTVTYSITAGNTDSLFAINAATGAITLSSTALLNFERQTTYTLTIRGTDNGFGVLSSTRNVTINVTNANEAPSFNAIQQVLFMNPNVTYNATTGNFYRLISTTGNYAAASAAATAATLNGVAGYLATSTSAAENALLQSMITTSVWLGGTDSAVEGQWRWAGGPDAGMQFWQGAAAGSAQNGYYTNWNGSEPNDSGGIEDGMQLLTNGRWNDINLATSLPYIIEWTGASVMASLQNGPYTIAENVAGGTSVGFAHARDPDSGDTISYSITGGTGFGSFAINATTGEITLTNAAAANYELASSYTLNLLVQDVGGLTNTTTVTINISDVNETPVLDANTGATLNEGAAIVVSNTMLASSDVDAPPDSALLYTLTSAVTHGTLVNTNTALTLGLGDTFTQGDIDNGYITYTHDDSENFTDAFAFTVSDGFFTLPAATFNLIINPVNEVPVITGGTPGPYAVNENVALGTSVATIPATDPDTGDVLAYTITGGTGAATFAINPLTGAITTIGPLNYESVSSYTLDIRVQDIAGLFDTATITININDINDVPTDITLSHNRVTENEPIGTLIGLLSTTDEDPADTHTYSFVSNPFGKFGIVGNQIQTIGAIDYEAHQNITVIIRTDDGNGGTYDESFVIYINDVMDTYVAPPPPPPTGPTSPTPPAYEPLGEGSAQMIKSTLFGGEEGQTGAFYGLGKFFQILRDNTTFQLRRLTGTDIHDGIMMDDKMAEDTVAGIPPDDTDFTGHYTNIRQALEFLSTVQAAQDNAAATPADIPTAEQPNDAFIPLDMQFVDVMTYHEQKQQHLRKALLGQ